MGRTRFVRHEADEGGRADDTDPALGEAARPRTSGALILRRLESAGHRGAAPGWGRDGRARGSGGEPAAYDGQCPAAVRTEQGQHVEGVLAVHPAVRDLELRFGVVAAAHGGPPSHGVRADRQQLRERAGRSVGTGLLVRAVGLGSCREPLQLPQAHQNAERYGQDGEEVDAPPTGRAQRVVHGGEVSLVLSRSAMRSATSATTSSRTSLRKK